MRDELLAYIHDVAKNKLQLSPHVSFRTKVNTARFRDGKWTVEVENVDTGVVETKEHTFLVSAVGQLNVPLIPEQFDVSKFKNAEHVFHTAQWPDGVDLTGKRVAVIGTGATAVQLVPELTKICEHVHVFQRSKVHLFPKQPFNYPWVVLMMFKHVPFAMSLYRLAQFLYQESVYFLTIPGVNGSYTNTMVAKTSLDFMKEKSGGENLDLLLPTTMVGCKRLLFGDEWCGLFKRGNNATLHAGAASEITLNGVKSPNSGEVEVDAIILSTGFKTLSFLDGLQIEAWDEPTSKYVNLHRDVWGPGNSEAYCGVTVKQMPNFAICYAANTNLNHSSIVSIIEAEVEHFGSLMQRVIHSKHKRFCVKSDAHDKYNALEQELLRDTVFNADCGNWYRSKVGGKIYSNFHGGLFEYWWNTATPKWEDYNFS